MAGSPPTISEKVNNLVLDVATVKKDQFHHEHQLKELRDDLDAIDHKLGDQPPETKTAFAQIGDLQGHVKRSLAWATWILGILGTVVASAVAYLITQAN